MSPPNENPTPALRHAVSALTHYRMGSGRANLTPLDEAVCAALRNAEAQASLELLLVQQLEVVTAVEAKRYICEKLRWIGSAACVPAVSALLADPEVGYEARATLELIPDQTAGDALNRALAKINGNKRIGIIDALARRRDPSSIGLLERGLHDVDHAVVQASMIALGRLGTAEAGRALLDLLRQPPDELRIPAARAALDCAGKLFEHGHTREGILLCEQLTESVWPALVRKAAEKLLESSAA